MFAEKPQIIQSCEHVIETLTEFNRRYPTNAFVCNSVCLEINRFG
jgi:hypothetical protein